jgi:hypothetical protein
MISGRWSARNRRDPSRTGQACDERARHHRPSTTASQIGIRSDRNDEDLGSVLSRLPDVAEPYAFGRSNASACGLPSG